VRVTAGHDVIHNSLSDHLVCITMPFVASVTDSRFADTSHCLPLSGQLPTLLCDAKQLTEVVRHSEASIIRKDSQVQLTIAWYGMHL